VIYLKQNLQPIFPRKSALKPRKRTASFEDIHLQSRSVTWIDLITRFFLSVGLFILVAILAVQAASQNGAMPVLEKLLSLLGMAVAFFFGQKSANGAEKDDSA
jgi:hypothetical protein